MQLAGSCLAVLGALGSLLAALGLLLGTLGAILAALGGSWVALEALGSFLGSLGAIQMKFINFMNRRSPWGMIPPKENQGVPARRCGGRGGLLGDLGRRPQASRL